MACFVVPVGEAVITTVIQKVVEKKEKKNSRGKTKERVLSWSQRLRFLNGLLWGGSLLLAFEHIWHGEVVPWPPFLTAMRDPADVGPMFHEIATIGVGMAIFVTFIWAVAMLTVELKASISGLNVEYKRGG
ncbi:MAG: hypothetical protein ABIN61_02385 [candidate division WOR-3 bacterium]